MTDTMTSQNIDLSSWDTLYKCDLPLLKNSKYSIKLLVHTDYKFTCRMRHECTFVHLSVSMQVANVNNPFFRSWYREGYVDAEEKLSRR
jgi:hypothetical protein